MSPSKNSLEMALFGFLARRNRLVGQVEALEKRLAVLEDAQHPTKLLEWVELAERLQRYLSRLSAVEQRLKHRENGDDTTPPQLRALLKTKFPSAGG